MEAVREYESKLDAKRRLTLCGIRRHWRGAASGYQGKGLSEGHAFRHGRKNPMITPPRRQMRPAGVYRMGAFSPILTIASCRNPAAVY